LTGFSLGGDAVFWFAHYPRGDRFQRLWAVDPAVRADTPIPPPRRPVLLHHGFGTRHLVSEFKEAAGLVECPGRGALTGDRLICDLGLEHVATCRAAYAEGASYNWLLSAAGPAETKV
jgi:hypothetical protein